MTINTLHDVYEGQLQDLYSACTQSLETTTTLAGAATDRELAKALIAGGKGIAQGMDEIRSLCAAHDINPEGTHCKGMEGLVKEAHAHVLNVEFGDNDVRDAMIITQYQRMVHYALAGYGCLVAFANRLELAGDAAVLHRLLDDTYAGDRHMTEIATGKVTAKAA